MLPLLVEKCGNLIFQYKNTVFQLIRLLKPPRPWIWNVLKEMDHKDFT